MKRVVVIAAVLVAALQGPAAWNEGAPRINGPKAYGATPGRDFLYAFPTTGDRNGLTFSVSAGKLPDGASLDVRRGVLSGKVGKAGTYRFTVKADNGLGTSEKAFALVIGADARALTPPMGWTSWSAFTSDIDQELIAATAKAIVQKGLAAHGYAYVNIDSCWQGRRNRKGSLALQPNELFPDMGGLVKYVHALGLKAGLYSTPMVHAWGSRDDRLLLGSTDYPLDPKYFQAYYGGCGQRGMEPYDAAQFAEWGVDWLKYDWPDTEPYHGRKMREALDQTSRDITLQLCVGCKIADAPEYVKFTQLTRGNGDTFDKWSAILDVARCADPWLKYVRPGYWYDLDMLAVGAMRIFRDESEVPAPRPGQVPDKRLKNNLTPEEVTSHFAWWAIIPVPLFLSCDIVHMDDFTLSLVTNDDLIEINQDYPATPATFADFDGGKRRLWTRRLSDGRTVLGFFNLGEDDWSVNQALEGAFAVRDVMERKDLGQQKSLAFTLKPHACKLCLLSGTSK